MVIVSLWEEGFDVPCVLTLAKEKNQFTRDRF